MKYAIITGASSGFGAATAQELQKMGYGLVLLARRLDRLETLQKTLTTTPVYISMYAVKHMFKPSLQRSPKKLQQIFLF